MQDYFMPDKLYVNSSYMFFFEYPNYITYHDNWFTYSVREQDHLTILKFLHHPELFFHVLNEIFAPPCSLYYILFAVQGFIYENLWIVIFSTFELNHY